MQTKTIDVTALGETLIDFTFQGMSPNGQRLFEQNAGGAPANMLASVNKCGFKTAFLGKVGNDMHGLFLKETLEHANIDTTGLLIDDNFFTTLAFVGINEQGERNFSFARKPGADTQISPAEIDLDILSASRVFHVGSLSLTDQPAREATIFALEKAKELGCIVTYDPNYRASLWENEETAMEQMRSLIPYADIMKISDEECALLTGDADPCGAAAILGEKGVKIVTVTLGADGALVYMKGISMHVPGFVPAKVADTTGAGDSFFGGFVAKLLQTEPDLDKISLSQVADCARFGNAVASLCVENRGGIPSMPDYVDSMARFEGK